LYVSWCGDTQMCLMDTHGNVKLVNQPHKPNSPNERSRIEQLGGQVDYVSNDWRVNNSLSVSRSFGDISHKKFIIAEPDVLDFYLDENTDHYLILGKFYFFLYSTTYS
jgi:serine/threonine protein phosphatase PrpC